MPGKDTVLGLGDSFRFSTDCGVLAKDCSLGSRTYRSLKAGELSWLAELSVEETGHGMA